MKTLKKMLCAVLALALVLSLCAFTYDRGPHDTLVYTALGDSASNGYGMEEYGDRQFSYGLKVSTAYPAMFAKAIGATTFNVDCLAGFRAEEIAYLLDPDCGMDDEYTFNMALNPRLVGLIGQDGIRSIEHLSELYIQHVKEADVISLNVGANSFGTFLTESIDYYLRFGSIICEVEDYLDLVDSELLDSARALFLELFGSIEITEGMTVGTVDDLVDHALKWFAYAYVHNMKAFDSIINTIYELNPDCELYVLGLYNPFRDVCLTDGNVNIGVVLNALYDSVNSYYQCFAPHAAEYFYVDISDTEVFESPENLTDADFMDIVTADHGKAIHPSYAGHAYMFDQLMAQYETPFNDVLDGSSRHDAIAYAYNNYMIDAVSDRYFMPDAAVSRANVAQALYVAAGSPDIKGLTEKFNDVTPSTEHYEAIVWASAKGIMPGTTGKYFTPAGTLSRTTFASILYKFAGSPSAGSVTLKDKILIASSGRSAAQWCVSCDLIEDTNGYFLPGLYISRSDLSYALYHLHLLQK